MRPKQSGEGAVGIARACDASYGVASLGLMQGQLASAAGIKRAPRRLPSLWRVPGSRSTPRA
jgi:hypothetical protein